MANEPMTDLVAVTRGELAKAEIESLVDLAHRYKRDPIEACQQARARATHSMEIAEKCFYALPPRRKFNKQTRQYEVGEPIMGPSIRLAEIFQGQWGNLFTGARLREVDRNLRMVHVECFAFDAEKVVRTQEEVSRRFYGEGDKEADGIALAMAAAKSIGIRNCLRRLIGPEIQEVYEECKEMVEKQDKPSVRIAKALARFKDEYGVESEKILTALGIDSADHATRRHVSTLLGIYNALREGTISLSEAFDTTEREPIQPTEEIPPARKRGRPRKVEPVAPQEQPPAQDEPQFATDPEYFPEPDDGVPVDEVPQTDPRLETLLQALTQLVDDSHIAADDYDAACRMLHLPDNLSDCTTEQIERLMAAIRAATGTMV